MTIEEIRKALDLVDEEIIRLLDKRAALGKRAGEIKRELNLPLHHPEREKEILRRVVGLSDGTFPGGGLKRVFRTIMSETLALQKDAPEPGSCPDSERNGMQDIQAVVTANEAVASGFYQMRLQVPELAGVFTPGQFFQLRLGDANSGLFLRRPFAPSEYRDDGFSFVYAVVGEGTKRLAALTPGAKVGILAPLGNGYTLQARGGTAILFGGGCGGPSLAPLAAQLHDDGVKVIILLGARSGGALLECGGFSHCGTLKTATDDGSVGCHGTVIDAFTQEVGDALPAGSRFYACGPMPMLKAVAKLAEAEGVVCEVSLEQRMACGFGACMGCAVPVLDDKGGSVYRRVCHEGPVFNAADLSWDEISQ